MADPWHHAVSSARRWGGVEDDYLPVHNWFDETKKHFSDPRHRALRHHSEGIGLMISIFGPKITLSTCARCGLEGAHVMHDPDYRPDVQEGHVHEFVSKDVPTRWVGEQHVLEDFGRIPTAADFLRLLPVEGWMVRGARKLSVELERSER
jgi:hypothetical protein